MRCARLIPLWLTAVLFAGTASAQNTGTILGTVTDSTGGVLPTAEIVVQNIDTGITRTATTDDKGLYRVNNVNIGEYQITATMTGFQTAIRKGISVTIGREAVVDLTLSLGDVTEDVTVSGDAPLVETRSGSLGTSVDRDTILEIPLNGRDLTGLITLQVGTTQATTAQAGNTAGYSNKFSIGGARPSDNSILMDGTDVKYFDQGVPSGISGNFTGGEAIQEFKVERNSYSAQFGGSAGGVINVVSKSGTNAFHGSTYGFFRNDAMDAANFRAPATFDANGNFTGKEKPDFARAQYGASVGGRIIRNRTFYFGNFEGLRERLGTTAFMLTLTPAARQGILPGRTVTVNPKMVPYLALWPMPGPTAVNLGDGTAREAVPQNTPTDERFLQWRIDHNLSDADAMYGRVTWQTSDRTTPQTISRWFGDEKFKNLFITGEERKILSSQLLNTLRVGFNRREVSLDSKEDPGVDASLFMVSPEHWRYPLGAPPIMGTLIVTGLSEVGLGRGWVSRATNNIQVADEIVYTLSAHTLKVGVNWLHTFLYGDSPSRPGGEVNFNTVDELLRGTPRQFRGDILPETDSIRHLHWNTVGTYIQDDWRASSRLTMNLGLRYGFYTVPTESDDKIANLRDPLDRTITLGSPWWKNPSRLSFAPRLGVSWDPTGAGRMAIRGGAGIFYNDLQPEALRQTAWRTAPFALESNFQALPGVIPFPDGVYDFIVGLGAQQGDIFLFPFETKNPRMYQWNLNVQREILSNMAFTAGYSGSRGKYLTSRMNENAANCQMINDRCVFAANAVRPNSAFNLDLTSLTPNSSSWYNSVQFEIKRRFQGGWQLQAGYTYSRALDLTSQYNPTFSADGGNMFKHDLNRGKGLAAFHVSNRFTASGIWLLPLGSNPVLGGWQLSGILNVSDGSPVTITMSTSAALAAIGFNGQRPDLVGGGDSNPVLGDPDKYFDVLQFTPPPTSLTIGNLGRNTLINPGLVTVDMGLTKNVTLPRGARFQFRAEFFNLLNRPNLGTPALNVFNASGVRQGNAGFIGATATTARQIQLGTRLEW